MWWFYIGWLAVWILWWQIACYWFDVPSLSLSMLAVVMISGFLANIETSLRKQITEGD